MSGQKSLFAYFSKTPTTKKETDESKSDEIAKEEISSSPSSTKKKTTKNATNGLSTSNGTTPKSARKTETPKEAIGSTPKRKKQDQPTKKEKSTPKTAMSSPVKKRKRIQIEDDDEEEEDEIEGKKSPDENVKLASNSNSPEASFRNSSSVMDESGNLPDLDADESTVVAEETTDFEHTKEPWLQPDQIRDANRRRPDDEDYDPTTLFVPSSYLDKLTPGLRRWWEFKSQNFDKILLYKVGKFYEIYHMDAEVVCPLLNLTFMKGGSSGKNVAHCGFPEISFGRFSDQLVQKGFKVARIEQTEKPEEMEKRVANTPGGSKKDRLVRRELCRIITPGTKTYSYIDGDDGYAASRVLLALCETSTNESRRYGVCFVDCAVGKVWISEFDDDYHCSRLRTLLAQYPPAEVLYAKKRLTNETEIVLKGLTSCALEPIRWKAEFLPSTDALKMVSSKGYFRPDDDEDGGGSNKSSGINDYPVALRATLDESDVLGTKCKSEWDLGVSAFGAVLWYLEKCCIDYDIMTLKLLEKYDPPGTVEEKTKSKVVERILPQLANRYMVLDSAALTNLDILQSSSKPNSTDGTLIELLDSCSTQFGKRLLRFWLCNPLCHVEAIKERQEAVGALLKETDFMEKASDLLKEMPDLERLLQKVHTMGTKKRADHPDSRAVFFEAEKYNKRKVDEFLTSLDGLRKVVEISDEFKRISGQVNSRLLQRCLVPEKDERNRLPNVDQLLKQIESKFDRDQAKKDGTLVMIEDVAGINKKISKIEAKFEYYLREQRKKFSCSAIRFTKSKAVKNRYQLEIPDAMASRMKDGYKYVGEVKGFRRYLSDELDDLLEELLKAEEEKESVFSDSMRRVFEMFSDRSEEWRRALDCMAILDVLLALARYVQNCVYQMCVPSVVNASGNEKPFIEITNGYHPCSSRIFTQLGQFVPNDTALGKGTSGSVLLLTGPNMGGKSTLMRQVATLVVLAQLGSYVPAESMSLSLVDRIFTRLGACDRLSAGQSTFAVELTEANMILRHSTPHSLVVVDELGRGTATHDGAAIAYAVLKHLADGNLGPRTIFSTHYHSLVTRLRGCSNIALGHMACEVENEADDESSDSNPSNETITFLYKLAPGPCPKSYGFNAAKLAGISKEIVEAAYAKAHEIDRMLTTAQQFRSLADKCSDMSDDELIAAVGSISIMSE